MILIDPTKGLRVFDWFGSFGLIFLCSSSLQQFREKLVSASCYFEWVFSRFPWIWAEIVKRRIRKGIPESMRAAVWPLLFGVEEMVRARNLNYKDLLDTELKKEDEVQIKKDIDRTFPENYLFSTPEG